MIEGGVTKGVLKLGANLKNPFGPSCCDGGASSCEMSAQSCGCDKGANWICERHRNEQAHDEATATSQAKPYITLLEVKLLNGLPLVSISPEILTGSSDIREQALSLMRRLCNLTGECEKFLIKMAEEAGSSLENPVSGQRN